MRKKENDRIGLMYCPECSHFINEEDLIPDEHDNIKCPNCHKVTLMRRWTEKDE